MSPQLRGSFFMRKYAYLALDISRNPPYNPGEKISKHLHGSSTIKSEGGGIVPKFRVSSIVKLLLIIVIGLFVLKLLWGWLTSKWPNPVTNAVNTVIQGA